ncbi:MAG: alcohol dehydrogenase catalytic domain-containing protein [Stappiaceae bacterium]
MQAVIFTGPNEVLFGALPDPKPGPDEVVLEVKSSGICHTDYEVLKANYGTSAFPVVPGHEYAGTVVEVGDAVTTVSTGDRVVVDPNIECGTCRACQRGWAHLCETLGAYGVTQNGGFSQYSVVKASAVHIIGEMSFSQAALAEPMGCVLNGVDAVYAPGMEEVIIFGAGPMGLLMGIALKTYGVPEITLCDISENRLDLAASFGFDTVISLSSEMQDWHHRADLAVDATGVPAVAGCLVDYIANGGKGLFFGVCPSEARIDVAPFELFRRQLTLAGSHSLNHNIPKALATNAAYGPDIERVVSHRASLEEVSKILSTSPPGGSLKIQATRD